MSHRFSFDNDDEASFRPRHDFAQPDQQYTSARGRDYEVTPAQHYLPQDPPPLAPYHDEEPYARNPFENPSIHSSNPLEQAHGDPHDFSVPPPPPHRRMSSGDGVPRGAAYGAVGGMGAGAAADTAYHGAGGYEDYQAYNPFEHAEPSNLPPSTNPYPEYPHNPVDDPFSSQSNTYNNLAVPNSYEMQHRSGAGSRPNSYGSPYGNYDHAASEGDLGSFDPRDIADEEDDTGAYAAKQKYRGSAGVGAAGVAGAAGAAAGAAAFAKNLGSRDPSGNYNAVPGGGGGGSGEKGTAIVGKASQGKRLRWMVGALIAIVIILAIVGGVVGAYVTTHKHSSSSSDSSSDDNGSDLDANSSQIKKLMNNPNMHKVFPGMDYTPFNAQYPDCLSNPPSQNNVTMDLAVLSQLTPQVRLYGTDCNQTEMVLHAIEKLNLKDSVKVWLGVYLNGNATTNDRQLQQMWNVLDSAGPSQFQGLIVGNEVLFSNYMPESQLVDTLNDVKKNLTSKNINLPLATSDLGDNWNDTLAQPLDYVMANVHPFFGGVAIDQAAAWTYSYWQTNDVGKTNNLPNKKQVISEFGWPSGGGQDCTDENGANVPCPNPQAGAIASVDNMNTLMNDWVCQALTNGTQYFWFEAFDEPWKVQFNKPGQEWEDKWGLMDPGRNLKPGLSIPSCNGKQATLP